MSGRKIRTVKKRIFVSNALMILVTLAAIVLINLLAVKIQWEFIERDWQSTVQKMDNTADVEELLKDWTVHQRSFYVLVIADVLLCASLMVGISLIFTRNLERHLAEEREKNAKYEKARIEMIAGISHDLRTPLTAIRGTIKALMDGVVTDPEKQDKFLMTAYRRTEDMNILLGQLFYVSQLETGAMPLRMQNIDLGEYLAHYVENKKELLIGEQIAIRLRIEEGTYRAWIDPEALGRILDNLLENSRKYAETEKQRTNLQIDISLKNLKDTMALCFRDNGAGVAPEKLPHIFEEFYRADESRNQKSGNGLGLYVVKSLMEAMGGSVSAANEQGLAIRMQFPRAKER